MSNTLTITPPCHRKIIFGLHTRADVLQLLLLKILMIFPKLFTVACLVSLQCFDAVGWVAGRASGL